MPKTGEMPFCLEGEQILREGESRVYSIVWSQFSTMSTAGVEIFTNGSSDSAAILSGTSAVAGNVQQLPTITVPTGYGGLTLVAEATVAVAGSTYATGIVIRVLKPGQES